MTVLNLDKSIEQHVIS